MAVCGGQGAGRRREADDGVIESGKLGRTSVNTRPICTLAFLGHVGLGTTSWGE